MSWKKGMIVSKNEPFVSPRFYMRMTETISEIIKQPPHTWYALRTFNCQELKLSDYLDESGKEHFIPMTYVERRLRDGKTKRLLVPVVHNLIFLKKDASQSQTLKLLSDAPVPVHVFRSEATSECYEIPDREMWEFRLLCDPSFDGSLFVTQEEAEARPGKEVRVVHGPFAGFTGKLHRMNKEYYFIKAVAGIAVMVRIPRCFCRVLK